MMTKKIKVKMMGTGTQDDPYLVNLPTWQMDGVPDYVKKECYVSLPDDETEIVNGKINVNQQRIREKYKKGWSEFNASDVEITI